MTAMFRTGTRNARNIYLSAETGNYKDDHHIACTFAEVDGPMVAEALNALHRNRNTATAAPTPVHQFMVRAFLPDQNGKVATDDAQPYRTYYAFAPNEQEAARVFHARNPQAVIRDLWQLMPPGYLGANVFTPDRDDRDLCEVSMKVNGRKVDEGVAW